MYTLSTLIYHIIGIYYKKFRDREETTKYRQQKYNNYSRHVHMKDDITRHLVSLICSILVVHVAIIRPLDGKTMKIYI